MDRGERPRTDDFLVLPDKQATQLSAPWGQQRPPAEELLESFFIRAGNAYEERKLPHMAVLFANLCFRGDISPAYAHQLMSLADSLSYRQLGCLAIFSPPTRPQNGGRGR